MKGKPPTKKAKVLQKQPLMAKLAAYAQYQSNQQSPAKSKSGKPTIMQSNNRFAWFFIFFNSERDTCILYYIMSVSFQQLFLSRASTGVGTFVAIIWSELQWAVSNTCVLFVSISSFTLTENRYDHVFPQRVFVYTVFSRYPWVYSGVTLLRVWGSRFSILTQTSPPKFTG